jgi:cytochrome c oxidase assembly protein subunit 15
VVASVLNPLTVSLHMVLALLAVSSLIMGTQNAYYFVNPQVEKETYYPCKMKMAFWAMALVLFIEIILGTELRAGLEMVRKDNPLVESILLLKMIGPFKYIHTILGVALAGLSGWIWYFFANKSDNPSLLVKRTSLGILVLVMIQILVGELMVFSSVSPIYQLFHMWSATWVLGLLIVTYGAWKRSKDLK